MTPELLTLQIALFIAGSFCTWRAAVALARGTTHPLYVATIVHCAFAVAPVLMGWVWGSPSYKMYVYMRTVNDSTDTYVVYYLFAIIVCFVLLAAARLDSRRRSAHDVRAAGSFIPRKQSRIHVLLLWLALIFPVLWALTGGDPDVWENYGAILTRQVTADNELFVNVLYWSTYLAVLGACGLIIAHRALKASHAIVFLFVGAALWLNGKRNIVVLAVLLIMISLRIARIASPRAFSAILGTLLVAFLIFSQWYQTHYRPVLAAFDTTYEAARMDFGRDSDVRMAIFAELHPNTRQILPNRGDSFLFDLLYFVPRSVWPSKPRPYYYYITAVALRQPLVARAWGITTTILGESIANAGFLGFLLGPLIVIVIGKLGYSPEDPFLNLLTALICTLFLSIHLAGFTVLWTAWCLLVVRERFLMRRRRPILYADATPELDDAWDLTKQTS